jgi:hypothetical protein
VSGVDDLVQWLRAQLDEDERIARENSDGRGLADGFPDYRTYSDGDTAAADEYIEHFGPARVLREIEAKRRIVDRYAWLREHGDTGGTAWVLPLLALPYADRPGYREEWRP